MCHFKLQLQGAVVANANEPACRRIFHTTAQRILDLDFGQCGPQADVHVGQGWRKHGVDTNLHSSARNNVEAHTSRRLNVCQKPDACLLLALCLMHAAINARSWSHVIIFLAQGRQAPFPQDILAIKCIPACFDVAEVR